MRYIGRNFTSTLVQIDPDRNAYVNVKSFGATGLSNSFTGRVRGIGGEGTILTLGEIANFSSFADNYFKVDQEIQAFFYLMTSAPGSQYQGIFSSASAQALGNVVNSGANSKRLTYFAYPYNPVEGVFSPYRTEFTVENVYKDPKTQFDESNYVRLTLTRSTSSWVPVIFRRWGTGKIEYLGTPSNIKFGSSATISFDDTGPAQIPSWDESIINAGEFFPEFLKGIVSFSSDTITPYTMIAKKRLRIISATPSGNVELVDASNQGANLSDLDNTALYVKFFFDDTQAIQRSIDFAAENGVKEVFVPAGTYHVRNLRIYDSNNYAKYNGVAIKGAGESSVLKRMPSVVNPSGQFGVIGILGGGASERVTGVTISNLAFDGNKTDVFPILPPQSDIYGIGDKYNDSIALEYVDSVRIVNCEFYNGSGSAIYALNSEKINITNNRVYRLSRPYENNVSPLKVKESGKAIIQGNLFDSCSGPLDFTGIEGSTINNNIINNCGETGLLLNASDTWSAQGNLTFNQSGSVVRSTDLYNNEFSRVSLDVKKGIVMPPVYFTVTEGNLPVSIVKDTIRARVYPLTSSYSYDTSGTERYLQVVESTQQLEAGIFAITAPISTVTGGTGTGSNAGKSILGTSSYDLLDPTASKYGYGYRITATVGVGRYAVSRVAWAGSATPNKVKIFLKNSADLLALYNLGAGGGNDLIMTSGIAIDGSVLENWTDLVSIQVSSIDSENSAIVVNTPSSVSSLFNDITDNYSTPAGYLTLIKTNYFIADGNIYVSE